ncbi:LysR family transcriptional regulator [Paracoccus zhejiangensis]|uniref:HTH lysR-type domain-containing protein n=1 Tax=Paracoccus zhejiangensis TaxID=1077935 RepID=A0A2H5EWQ0_9RHOB|nr:LysR family transcriptional regulator [Paracoccus zhejiangensis]AUH63717.1 hypothetical protein CX676_05715 [Paracoccus zhejiangensis]
MDVRDLSYLQAIIRTGSVTAAADEVGRTAPAITKAIRRLEQETGTALFRRAGRGIEPTEAALFLTRRTQGMTEQLQIIRRQLTEISRGQHGHIRLGVAATMAAIFLPGFLSDLSVRHPNISVSVINGMNDVLRAALREGEIDIALGVIDRPDEGGIETLVITEDQVRIAASLRHRLQGRPLAAADLSGESWLLPARGVAMRQWLDAAFTASGLPAPIAQIETNSIAVLEDLIAGSDHLSFVSGLKMRLPHVASRIGPLRIEGFTMRRQIGATWLQGAEDQPTVALVIERLRAGSSVIRDGAAPA